MNQEFPDETGRSGANKVDGLSNNGNESAGREARSRGRASDRLQFGEQGGRKASVFGEIYQPQAFVQAETPSCFQSRNS